VCVYLCLLGTPHPQITFLDVWNPVSSFSMHRSHLEDILKPRILCLTVSNSGHLEYRWIIYIFIKLPGNMGPAGLGTRLWTTALCNLADPFLPLRSALILTFFLLCSIYPGPSFPKISTLVLVLSL
jgi:hypothetical protein